MIAPCIASDRSVGITHHSRSRALVGKVALARGDDRPCTRQNSTDIAKIIDIPKMPAFTVEIETSLDLLFYACVRVSERKRPGDLDRIDAEVLPITSELQCINHTGRLICLFE